MKERDYLNFFNSLGLNINFVKIVKEGKNFDRCDNLPNKKNWLWLDSTICLSEAKEIYEIDIRYSCSKKIFEINLVDVELSKQDLLEKITQPRQKRNKIIIYLCEESTGLDSHRWELTSQIYEHNFMNHLWQDVYHVYLLLPMEHPFVVPEKNIQQENYAYILNREIPLITIITVVFNGKKYLETTIQSVINQTYENLQYIIVDGNSQDGTIDIINKYANYIDRWLSEPDFGVYDAMNKGWSLANNDSYILFLGAGDEIVNLPTIKETDKDKKNILGQVFRGEGILFKSQANWRIKLGNSLHHQALLIHKSWHPQPPFNLEYKVYADYDFNSRLWQKNAQFISDVDFISYSSPAGLSAKLDLIEMLKIIKSNYKLYWVILASVYYFYQGIKYGFDKIKLEFK